MDNEMFRKYLSNTDIDFDTIKSKIEHHANHVRYRFHMRSK